MLKRLRGRDMLATALSNRISNTASKRVPTTLPRKGSDISGGYILRLRCSSVVKGHCTIRISLKSEFPRSILWMQLNKPIRVSYCLKNEVIAFHFRENDITIKGASDINFVN